MFLFGVFRGMCDESSFKVFMLLFMILWFPISVMLCMRAVLMLWHAFLFLGLRFSPPFFFWAWWLLLLFLVRIFDSSNHNIVYSFASAAAHALVRDDDMRVPSSWMLHHHLYLGGK
jgi:hypothetical protein